MKDQTVETTKELAEKVLEKRVISENKKEEETTEIKEAIKVDEHHEADGSLKVRTVYPLFIDCPYCGEKRKPKGIGGHVREKHGVPGVSMQELLNLKDTDYSLEDFTREKFGNKKDITIRNIPTEIIEREFPTWKIPDLEEEKPEEDKTYKTKEIMEEEKPEEILEEEIPEVDEENPDNPGPPGDPSCYENPGNPGEGKNFVERRKFNLIPFFFPFQRRNYRK